MKEQIKTELRRLETENAIKILYAVESGSRAWGFASQDSDWDVRFIYIHTYDWYLSVDDKKDNIEQILPNDIDLAGWELRKALRLFRKSNPPLLEWLNSPIVYLDTHETAAKLRELANEFFNVKSCLYHYLSMAHRNYREYLQTELVRTKKYFYVLRPLLACNWLEKNGAMAPVEFDRLVDTQVENALVKSEIQHLLLRKKSGDELAKEPKNTILDRFIEEQFEHFAKSLKDIQVNSTPDTQRLDELFRSTLARVWGNCNFASTKQV